MAKRYAKFLSLQDGLNNEYTIRGSKRDTADLQTNPADPDTDPKDTNETKNYGLWNAIGIGIILTTMLILIWVRRKRNIKN